VIAALADVYAQVAQRATVEQAMLRLQVEARTQPGCLSFTFARALEDPGHYLLVQTWSDGEAMQEHYRSAAFARYQAEVTLLLSRESELRTYEVQRLAKLAAAPGLDLRQDD
jgi:quinol monooxygenase YgiN